MPKQENTAINQLLGHRGRGPVADVPPRPRPAPRGASLAPSGPPIAALPRRRAPAATPPQVPLRAAYPAAYRADYDADHDADYDDQSATTVDPPLGWDAHPVLQPTPPPLPPLPPLSSLPPPVAVQPMRPEYAAPQPLSPPVAVQPIRPEYPAPHQPPAYYQAPYADHLDTMRVRSMPLERERSLGSEVLEWVAKLWMPFVAVGVLAMTLGVYRLVTHSTAPPAITSVPAIAMTARPAAQQVAAVQPEPDVARVVEPVEDHGVPKDSLWQPTKAQRTLAPRVEPVAAIDSEPAIEFEPVTARKPAARASSDRSSSQRASKRAAASRAADKQRAKQVALAEIAPTKVKEPKVVAIAAVKQMKIGAASAAAAKGAGAGKLSIESTPPTLIYVDGRNTGMMTPKTLSLPEGSHKITLLSPKDRIAKTISVEIEAGKSANLTRTFTK